MNCATHPDTAAVAFCRTCGKPLCSNCTRDVRGVVYCEPCLAARLEGTAPTAAFVPPTQAGYTPIGTPSGVAPAAPFRPTGSGGPHPVVAGILAGFFPFGVGAVYCSQYAKGLAHLLIFAMLIFATNHAGRWDFIFGLGIAFFYVYQIIDSVRTARALQEGRPAPDPYGLASTFSMGSASDKGESRSVPAVAIILIGLGVLFLLHTMNIFEFGLDRFWPLILIFFGGWMLAKQWGLISGRRFGCQCDRCRMRRIIGPSVLITIGTLFLLQSLNVVDFDRTWPAILLVIGIVKLLQSNASSVGHTGPFPPAMPGVASPPPPAPPADSGTPASGEVRNV
jgi:cell wall-active antibiotic response 4TMS protein YvqF/B-box zinc finger protein